MTTRVVVAGVLAGKLGNGGEAWVRPTWVRSLLDLGIDAWFVEELDNPIAGSLATSSRATWFGDVVARFGIADRSILIAGGEVIGAASLAHVKDLLADADLLINISGNLRRPDLFGIARTAAYVDLDPGFTQIWYASGVGDLGLERHHLHFTVGENIGTARSPLPTGGLNWLPCRQPVITDDFPASDPEASAAFSTVTHWRCGFGPVEWDGVAYGLKHHEFRRFIDTPRHTGVPLELALTIDPADAADRENFTVRGWRIVDAAAVCSSPDDFAGYVRRSAGEFSVAQGVYVHGRSGWFSDRSLRYLASGRPVVLQDTGFSNALPVGEGLLGFGTAQEAVAALEKAYGDLVHHGRAARRIAEEHFSGAAVLERFLAEALSHGTTSSNPNREATDAGGPDMSNEATIDRPGTDAHALDIARAGLHAIVAQDISPNDEMYQGNEAHYFSVGESAIRCIEAGIVMAGGPFRPQRILDLPCGHGRVLRWLRTRFPDAELTACDLNQDGVRFCAETFGAEPIDSHPDPRDVPLVGLYDMIWCGSLLTHLPSDRSRQFLELFATHLAPGGIVVITLHGRFVIRRILRNESDYGLGATALDLIPEVASSGYAYHDYPHSDSYGISLNTAAWALNELTARPELRVVSYAEQAWDGHHDVVAFTKVPELDAGN